MKAIESTMTAVTFLVVSLLALPMAFADDPITGTQAENAALRTIVNAQKTASPDLPKVPILTDAKQADVELLEDSYADVELLDDSDDQSKSTAMPSDLLAIR